MKEETPRSAAEAETSLAELIERAAHDLRSPLMTVGGYLELLAEEGSAESSRVEFIERARDGVSSVLRLVSAMVDIANLETGRRHSQPAEHSLDFLTHRAIDALGPMAKARVELRPIAPIRPLVCDADLVAKAIAGLLITAIKFSDEPETIGLSAEETSHGLVRIAIHCGRPGFSAEFRQRILGLANGAISASGASGAVSPLRPKGLELDLSARVAQAHGGSLGCSIPSDGGGSQVWIELARS